MHCQRCNIITWNDCSWCSAGFYSWFFDRLTWPRWEWNQARPLVCWSSALLAEQRSQVGSVVWYFGTQSFDISILIINVMINSYWQHWIGFWNIPPRWTKRFVSACWTHSESYHVKQFSQCCLEVKAYYSWMLLEHTNMRTVWDQTAEPATTKCKPVAVLQLSLQLWSNAH